MLHINIQKTHKQNTETKHRNKTQKQNTETKQIQMIIHLI